MQTTKAFWPRPRFLAFPGQILSICGGGFRFGAVWGTGKFGYIFLHFFAKILMPIEAFPHCRQAPMPSYGQIGSWSSRRLWSLPPFCCPPTVQISQQHKASVPVTIWPCLGEVRLRNEVSGSLVLEFFEVVEFQICLEKNDNLQSVVKQNLSNSDSERSTLNAW